MTHVLKTTSIFKARTQFPDAMILRPYLDTILVFESVEDARGHPSRNPEK